MSYLLDPDPNPDPLVRGMNPRIPVHPKMSWIRNTAPLFKEPAEGGDVQSDHGGLSLRARPLPSLQVEGHTGHQVNRIE